MMEEKLRQVHQLQISTQIAKKSRGPSEFSNVTVNRKDSLLDESLMNAIGVASLERFSIERT